MIKQVISVKVSDQVVPKSTLSPETFFTAAKWVIKPVIFYLLNQPTVPGKDHLILSQKNKHVCNDGDFKYLN